MIGKADEFCINATVLSIAYLLENSVKALIAKSDQLRTF